MNKCIKQYKCGPSKKILNVTVPSEFSTIKRNSSVHGALCSVTLEIMWLFLHRQNFHMHFPEYLH